MATSAYYPTVGSTVTVQHTATKQANFIPELWSDEVIAVYEQNLVVAPKVRKMSMVGKKGDVIHVPKPNRASGPNAKVEETSVTLIDDTADELQISIDQHWEYSRMIEDFADIQSLPSARRFYTDDAGYQLAKKVDSDLFSLGTGLVSGTPVAPASIVPADWEIADASIRWDDANSIVEDWAEDTQLAADVFTDVLFRQGLQYLDDQDVPMNGRCLIICPSAVNAIRGITRYNSVDFVNAKGTVTGEIGNIYGVPVYVSTNVPVAETAAQNAGDTTVASRANLLMHKDAYVLAEQMNVRSQTQYKQELLSTLFTADRIYGFNVYRPENAVNLITAE